MEHSQHAAPRRTRSVGRAIVTIIAELLLTFAAICGLYVAWMQWWTGVQSDHVQQETRA